MMQLITMLHESCMCAQILLQAGVGIVEQVVHGKFRQEQNMLNFSCGVLAEPLVLDAVVAALDTEQQAHML
jgi:hypothetical protein